MIDRIAEIAAAAGATLAAPVPAQELLSFVLLPSGDVRVTVANGDTFVVADTGEHVGVVTAATLLRHLLPMVPGRKARAGVEYCRREIVTAGGRRTVFLEAGR